MCFGAGRIQERRRVDNQRTYFNTFCILGPGCLTFLSLTVGHVEGNSVTGVCFLGLRDSYWNVVFLMAPLLGYFGICQFFFWRGVYRLVTVTLSGSDFITKEGRDYIKCTRNRVIAFSLGMIGAGVLYGVCQGLVWREEPDWERSLEEHLLCKLRVSLRGGGEEEEGCEVPEEGRGKVKWVLGQAVAFFVGGGLVASWGFTGETGRTWRRWLRKKSCCGGGGDGGEEGLQLRGMKKHQLISQAFGKRQQMQVNGRLSLSLNSGQGDPMGLNRMMDPTQLGGKGGDRDRLGESQQLTGTEGGGSEIDSEFAKGLPGLMERRGGLVPPHSSVSCVSEDYSQRRASYDSNVSEVTTQGAAGGREGHKK